MEPPAERAVLALVLVNLALQVLDGVATLVGLHAGIGEGNPLIASTVAHLGPAPALCLFKLEAAGCVLLLWRLRRSPLAVPALVFCATVYVVCALGPWTAALAALQRV